MLLLSLLTMAWFRVMRKACFAFLKVSMPSSGEKTSMVRRSMRPWALSTPFLKIPVAAAFRSVSFSASQVLGDPS